METVVVVLMILVSFNFLLKLTYCKLWTVGVIAVSACLFVGLMWPLAIEQSKTQIADWLSNPQLMLDTSVILSLEVVLQLAYCMLAKDTFKQPARWVVERYWLTVASVFSRES